MRGMDDDEDAEFMTCDGTNDQLRLARSRWVLGRKPTKKIRSWACDNYMRDCHASATDGTPRRKGIEIHYSPETLFVSNHRDEMCHKVMPNSMFLRFRSTDGSVWRWFGKVPGFFGCSQRQGNNKLCPISMGMRRTVHARGIGG